MREKRYNWHTNSYVEILNYMNTDIYWWCSWQTVVAQQVFLQALVPLPIIIPPMLLIIKGWYNRLI
jgi:hypothetical protein